jgi:hypothetical protein
VTSICSKEIDVASILVKDFTTGTRNTLNILKWELRLLSYFVDDRQLLELFSHLNVLLLDFSNSEHQFSIYPLFLAVKSIFLEKVS